MSRLSDLSQLLQTTHITDPRKHYRPMDRHQRGQMSTRVRRARPHQGVSRLVEAIVKKRPKHCPEIHGEDGIADVIGLSSPESPEVQARLARGDDGKSISALQGMVNALRKTWNEGAGRKVTIVSSGPMTNVAVFISAHPELLDGVEQFVFMGGGNGFGNITPAAGE